MKITFNLLLLFTQKKKRKESKQHSHYFLFPPIISWWFWQIFREQQVLKVNSNHRLIDAISIRGLYFVIKLLIQPTSYTRTEQKKRFLLRPVWLEGEKKVFWDFFAWNAFEWDMNFWFVRILYDNEIFLRNFWGISMGPNGLDRGFLDLNNFWRKISLLLVQILKFYQSFHLFTDFHFPRP